jgi:hypothetical protein
MVIVLDRLSMSVGTSKIMSAGRPVLEDLAVDGRLDPQRVGVLDLVAGDDGGAERAEAVETLPPRELPAAEVLVALPVARRDVVGDRVAEDVVHRVGLRNVLRVASDDDG